MSDEDDKTRKMQPLVREIASTTSLSVEAASDLLEKLEQRVKDGGRLVIFAPSSAYPSFHTAAHLAALAGLRLTLDLEAHELTGGMDMALMPRTVPSAPTVSFVHEMGVNQSWKPGRPRTPYFLRQQNMRHHPEARRAARKNRRR